METLLPLSNGIEALPQFLTSLAIGLLIGLERERNPSAKAGLRTFALVALLGTLTAMLSSKSDSPWLLVAGLCIVGATIIAAYLSSPSEENDPGTTTVVALLLCYGLGALVWYGQSKLAVMLAIGTTTLLYFKPELRGMTQRLTRRDLVSILQFSVLTFVILPILPDQNYGPYDAFNPHHAWMMVVLISGLSLAGYIALHWTGHRYGAPLLGFLGGLVSSTATTLVYARHSKTSDSMARLSAVVILIASQVVLIRLTVLSAVVSPDVLAKLLPVMGLGLMLGLAATLYDWRKLHTSSDLPMPKTSNPTEIHAALGFGLLYVVVLLCAAWLSDLAGNKGLYAVALVSGLTDVDAITLSSLRLFSLDKLSGDQAVSAIAIAFLSNMTFKFGVVIFIGGMPLAKHVAAGFAAMAAGVGLGLLFL
ncbi:MAG: MgtC/SapB family protein [Gallionellaceae bacterium]|nr:MgtC/SapB family protein [Gallionellaceae bacterium]